MTEIKPSDQPEMLAEDVGDAADVPETEAPTPEQVDAARMGGLPVEDWDYQQPKRGEIRTGVILAITDQEIIIDVGAKRDGVVPLADLQRMSSEALAKLKVGDKVPVYVMRPEDQDGNLMVSLYQARQEKDWQRARELSESGEVWEEQVIGFNKGGLVIPLGGIRGFVPASQIADFRPTMTPEERMERLSSMVGERLKVKVIEINQRKHRLILSATQAQRDWREQQRDRLLDELREGEVRHGVVTSLSPFGAFVDIGGADGLVHLSELSWRRVRHPRELLHVGDTKRIALSRKRLEPEPWALVEDNYELGQLVEGVITNVADFGAFAEIESGVEGLIHISELADKPVSNPREVVRRGERVLLRIIRIDTRRRRLGLSLQRVLESEWSEWAARTSARKEKPVAPQPVAEPPVQKAAPEPPVEEAEVVPPVEEAEVVPPAEEAEEVPPVEEAAPEPLVQEAEAEPPVEEAAPESLVQEAEAEPPVEEAAPEPLVQEAEAEPPVEEAEVEPLPGADSDLSVAEG
jgi:small subunit ribosomal protein S1